MEYFDSVIIFNGEIYNYIEVRNELKKKGYSFRTQSDTEVILAAYREYGTDCVNHFMGMWSFALWDKKKQILFCSRDRFGIKPFYYILEGDRFYFGSEYKVLKKSPLFSSELNLNQINRGLQMGWVCYHDETYYEKLKSLPAAYNLVYERGEVKMEKYWDIDPSKKFNGTFQEAKYKFSEMFEDSIRMHMRSDVEIGGCLSGGLDSSAITSAIAKYFPETSFKTFTIFYEGRNAMDERPWVKQVIQKYPSLTPYYLSPSDEAITSSFDRALYHADVPITGSSPISQYFVMQLAASQKIKVLVDGQGSDEYLAGYMHSFYRYIGGFFRQAKISQGWSALTAHSEQQEFSFSKSMDVLMKSVLAGVRPEQSLYNLEYKNYYPFLSEDKTINFSLPDFNSTRLNNFLYQLTFTTSLPSLLQFEDRNSMAFSIESRVPFLDHRLVEFVFSLPDECKIQDGETKYILRKSLNGLLPDAIAKRRDKKGFVTPGEIKWLRGPLKFLTEEKNFNIDFLNMNKVRSLLKDFNNGNNSNANLVWRLAVLNYWIKR
jgi:asparagine synthase (glutamine-hydrolysing)